MKTLISRRKNGRAKAYKRGVLSWKSISSALPLSVSQALTIIEEVERYPEFLPRVREVTDVKRNVDNGVVDIEMAVRVGFRSLSGKARTRLVIDRAARSATMNLIDGPFRRASVRMRLLEAESGARVVVDGDYDSPFPRFDNVLEHKLMALVDTVMSAVRQRAESRFGAASAGAILANDRTRR